MKKSILILVLALACLFSFASCKKETPYSLLNDANEKLEAAKGLEAKVTVDMKIIAEDGTDDQSFSMDLKVNGSDIDMLIKIDLFDLSIETPIRYVDGVMYMEEFGQKYKMEISADEFGVEYGSMGRITLPELTEEALKDIKLERDGDTKFFTVSIDQETSKKLLNESLLVSIMNDVDDITEHAKIDKLDLTFTFSQDNTLSKMTMVTVLLPTEEEDAGTTLEATTIYEFKNIGTAPTIEAPADADEYVDMSDGIG